MALSRKQAQFVAEYLIDLNACQAAIRAGYSAKTAESAGPQVLRNSAVAAAVAEGQAKRLQSAEISSVRILEEMRRLALSDLRQLFDASGNLRPIHELPDDVASTLSSVEVVKKNLAAGDGQTDTVHKLKTWDKPKALEMLAKHLGLLIERVGHTGTVVMRHELGD